MSRSLVRYIGRKSGQYPIFSLGFAIITSVVAFYFAFQRLDIQMDITTLLPRDSEVARLTRATEYEFGRQDVMLGILEVTSNASEAVNANPELFLRSILPDVQAALEDAAYFRLIGHRFRPSPAGLDDFSPAQIARLTDADFLVLENRVLPERLSDFLRRTSDRIQSETMTPQRLDELRRDPFGLIAKLERRSIFATGPFPNRGQLDEILSDDGRTMIFLLWPTRPPTDLIAAREMRIFLRETKEGLFERHPDWRGNVELSFLGGGLEAAEGETDIRDDITTTSIISLLAVLTLFFVAFRQPEAVLFVTLPLIVGIGWTLAIASLFVTTISQVSLTFAAIMIGLGIDFSIHLYNRYLEDFKKPEDSISALRNAINKVSPSLFAGAITTGLAFFAMTQTRFEGFQQLGLFGGIGILLCMLAVLITLPPMITISSRFYRNRRAPLGTLGLKQASFTVFAYPRMTVCAGLCIVAYLGVYATRVTFNDDFDALRAPSDSTVDLQRRVSSKLDLPDNPTLILVESDNLEDALRQTDLIYRNISASVYMRDLVSIDSLRLVFPSTETQTETLRRMGQLPIDRIRSAMTALLPDFPAIPAGFFNEGLDQLEDSISASRAAIVAGRPVISIDYEQPIDFAFLENVQRYVFRLPGDDEVKIRILTRVFPRVGAWSEGIPDGFQEVVATGLTTEPTFLGNTVLSNELSWVIISDLARIVLFVITAVAVYLTIYFRSVYFAALAMVPVFFAMLCMLGMVYLLGMELNYLNIIAVPLIIGIGVDSGIHFITRLTEGGANNLRIAIERTGRAILVTGLTTIFGFGSLCVASFQGIREIGIFAILGTFATLFAALVFLPALIRLLDPQFTYRGGSGDEIG